MLPKYFSKPFRLLLAGLLFLSLQSAALAAGASALLAPEELKGYIDAGYKTPDGLKVVIIDVDGVTPAKVIKGALPMPQDDYFTEVRSDGPVAVPNMVASGPKMDAALSKAGIDGNTLVVVTGSDLTSNFIHRVWWTFSYWGFPNEKVKILDGADKYFAAKYPSYMETPKPVSVKPSDFSVRELPADNINAVRASLGEVFDGAVSGAFKADGTGEKVVIATMPPAIPVNAGGKEVMRVGNNGALTGIIHGSVQINTKNNKPSQYLNEDGRYKSPEEIAGLITAYPSGKTFLPEDKNKRIITHCIRAQSTMPHFFVIKELLGYKNTAAYDGSWIEWGNLAYYMPASPEEPFTTGQASTYLVWDDAKGAYKDASGKEVKASSLKKTGVFSNSKFDAGRYTDWLTLSGSDNDGEWVSAINVTTFNNSYKGAGREVNEADLLYKKNGGR